MQAISIPPFSLIETILWEPNGGHYLLNLHIERLQAAATYFSVIVDEAAVRQALRSDAATLTEASKIRLEVTLTSAISVTSAPTGTRPQNPKLGFATTPVHSTDQFLYHKTTQRDIYINAKASRPDCDDVLLYNERDEVTEASSSNVVFELNGERVTPPISSGLLGGTMRRALLDAGDIREQIVTCADAKRASRVWLINSVRRWREGWLVDKD